MMRWIRWTFWLVALSVYALLGWIPGLVVLGLALIAFVLRAVRVRRALRSTVRCPRGHDVPTYGLYRCTSCGATTESWAWRCPHCRAESGFLGCPTCGLSVRSPLLGG